jgi:hypothetical protein
MLTNTLLSLVYVPVAYTYFDSFGGWLTHLFRREHGRHQWRGSLRRIVDGRPTAAGRPDVPGRDTPPIRPSSVGPRDAADAEPSGASRGRRR